MSRLSLRARIVLASVAALAVGAGLLSVAINALLAARLDGDARAALRTRTEAQLATLDVRKDRIRLRESPHDAILDQQAWVFVGRRMVERAVAPADVQRAVARLARVDRITGVDVDGRVRLRAQPVYGPGGNPRVGTAVVGLSLAPYRNTKRIALLGTLALDAFILLAGALSARHAVAAGLRPVADMSLRAREWGEHDLDRRFGLGPPRDELTGLAATLDALLARIAARRRHEQRFSAEMAHELRTPLSGMRGEAELALQPGHDDTELREALTRVVSVAERMTVSIETLLAIARGEADGNDAVGDAVEAAQLAIRVVREAARRRSVRLEVRADRPTSTVGADNDLIAQALHPLLDNGVRHARCEVSVSIETAGDRVRIAVHDDGPGIAAHDVGLVFEPGWRTDGGGGAGLGLALSRRLALACGGDVYADASADGGVFVLDLPAIQG